MSDLVALTTDPVPVTDGTHGAHITVVGGTIMYADSDSSESWHQLIGNVLEIRPPVVMYLKAKLAGGASAVVTTWSES